MLELENSIFSEPDSSETVSDSPSDGIDVQEIAVLESDAAEPGVDVDVDINVDALVPIRAENPKTPAKTKRASARADSADCSTDPLALYAKDVRKYALLSFEDEVRLTREYRAGNANS